MSNYNFPHEAIAIIDEILTYGKSKGYSTASWRHGTVEYHVNKAKGHITDWLYGIDRGEDHLGCALCRLAMAVSIREEKK
jgi:hypothetical protein